MTTTEIILSHWRSITPTADVAFHEPGFQRIIDTALRYSLPFVLAKTSNEAERRVAELTISTAPPQAIGDEVLS